MADNLPVNFPIPQEQSIASFSFTDIANGSGVVVFYTTISEDQSGKDYHLTDQQVKPAGWTSASATETRINSGSYIAFDTGEFNLPRTVKGTAYISGYLYSGDGSNGYYTMKISKWDGTTETDLTSEINTQTSNLSTGQYEAFYCVLPLTQTVIKKGEQLRVSFKRTSGTSQVFLETDATGTYPLKSFIPFEVNI